jgi:hypothetical protein
MMSRIVIVMLKLLFYKIVRKIFLYTTGYLNYFKDCFVVEFPCA